MILKYCYYLNIFNLLKTQFIDTAFLPDKYSCNNSNVSIIKATTLHNYTIYNNDFIRLMELGCNSGGNNSRCKISVSNVTDIIIEFDHSYYNYINNPKTLCTPFTEFSNNLENLFITGGCYLDKKYNKKVKGGHICKYSPKLGYPC